MFKTVQDMQRFAQGQIEATAQSAAVLSRGLQQIATETSDFSRRTVEHNSAHLAKLVEAGSLDGAIGAHADFARTSYENLMVEVAKFGEIVLAVTKNAYRPFEAALDQPAR